MEDNKDTLPTLGEVDECISGFGGRKKVGVAEPMIEGEIGGDGKRWE